MELLSPFRMVTVCVEFEKALDAEKREMVNVILTNCIRLEVCAHLLTIDLECKVSLTWISSTIAAHNTHAARLPKPLIP